jgi:hypothetical protein
MNEFPKHGEIGKGITIPECFHGGVSASREAWSMPSDEETKAFPFRTWESFAEFFIRLKVIEVKTGESINIKKSVEANIAFSRV